MTVLNLNFDNSLILIDYPVHYKRCGPTHYNQAGCSDYVWLIETSPGGAAPPAPPVQRFFVYIATTARRPELTCSVIWRGLRAAARVESATGERLQVEWSAGAAAGGGGETFQL